MCFFWIFYDILAQIEESVTSTILKISIVPVVLENSVFSFEIFYDILAQISSRASMPCKILENYLENWRVTT